MAGGSTGLHDQAVLGVGRSSGLRGDVRYPDLPKPLNERMFLKSQ